MNLNTVLASVAFATTLPALAVADTAKNKTFAIEALTATLGAGNPEPVDQYFDQGYIQHNPDIGNGTGARKGLISNLATSGAFKADFARVIADDDMVMLHGRYEGFGPASELFFFDPFRRNGCAAT
ncbi:nuclear transport factor 2 family protein [Sulfitobacter sp.]|uniref:nuclear transport factor 2 family protein n=1 Tax=Sulfitobacter sp. TaxID=1903071 RepID=UPI0030020681